MKVICKQTTSKGFNLKEVTTVLSTNFDYSFGGYGIELGKEYLVMGIALYKDSNCIYYLIDTSSKPDWLPFLLFEIVENSLPKQWHVKAPGKKENSDIYALWGFEELCNEETFYDRLLEREEAAMRTYFRRKIELEKEIAEQEEMRLLLN